jgi:hypothetical protein
MATTDIPTNRMTGEIQYELEQPMDVLQNMLNKKNIDIDSLDMRGEGFDVMFRGYDSKELQVITGMVNSDPELDIKSSSVRDLNDRFDKNLDNSNPNYIFRGDVFSRNNRSLIQVGNSNFAKERDFLTTPPPIDTQQQIFELLSK